MVEVSNPFRESLYSLGRNPAPEYAWQWFFRYFAGGPSIFPQEPADMLSNYKSLINKLDSLIKDSLPLKIYELIKDFKKRE